MSNLNATNAGGEYPFTGTANTGLRGKFNVPADLKLNPRLN